MEHKALGALGSQAKPTQPNLNAQRQTNSFIAWINGSSLSFQWVNLCNEYTSCCLCRRKAWKGIPPIFNNSFQVARAKDKSLEQEEILLQQHTWLLNHKAHSYLVNRHSFSSTGGRAHHSFSCFKNYCFRASHLPLHNQQSRQREYTPWQLKIH